MSKLLLILLSLLGADAKIKAPATAPVGQFVLIDGSASVGALTWSVPDEVQCYTSSNGKSIILDCPTARHVKVRLTATDAAGKSTDAEVIEFTGKPAPSPPAPLPAPMPDPVKPDKSLPAGRFKIAQGAFDESVKVKSTQRRAEAELLAVKLTSVRDRIQSGVIKADDPAAIMGHIQQATESLPKDVQTRWRPWGQWWGKALYDQWKAECLKTSADWVTILDETILGLKAVT